MHALRADLGDDASFRLDDHAESNRSVPPTRNGCSLIACTTRPGYSSPRAAATREPGVRARHALERKPEHDDAAAVDRLRDLAARHARPQRDLVEDPRCTCARGARSPASASPSGGRGRASRRAFRSSCCEGASGGRPIRSRLSRRAGEAARAGRTPGRPSSSPRSREHPLDDRDVLGLAAVRRAREGELLVAPAQLVEAAGAEKRHDLKGLGAGAPEGECVTIAGGAEQLIAFPDDGGVHAMFGFDPVTAGDTTSSSYVLITLNDSQFAF